jgi:hypothetical protein
MRLLRKRCLGVVAALLLSLSATVCRADIQPVPELLVRLWPFFRSTRPVVLLPEDHNPVEKRRSLVAPFVARKVDINSASFSELQDLPGIDSAMAARIFAGRPYRTVQDLERNGIPLDIVQDLADQVTFGP